MTDPREKTVYGSYPPRGQGGQHVGSYPGVTATHTSTGLAAVCDYERSQHKNRLIVDEMIKAGLAALNYQG